MKFTSTDVSGWRVGGAAAQLMVFTSPTVMVYQIGWQHRNKEVCEVIGDDNAGVI